MACVVASIKFDQRETSSTGDANSHKRPTTIIDNGAVIKNRYGTARGGMLSKDNPRRFISGFRCQYVVIIYIVPMISF